MRSGKPARKNGGFIYIGLLIGLALALDVLGAASGLGVAAHLSLLGALLLLALPAAPWAAAAALRIAYD